MNRRQLLKTACTGLAGLALPAQKTRKPNIVVIVADDYGYASLGAQGSDIPTANIDSIARNGVRFTNGYVSCPVCSPTRAGLMTGRYQQRFGHEFNAGPITQAPEVFGLPLTERTLADEMKSLGYATGMVGKWHLGYRPEFHPMKRGFDEYFGFLGGAHSYLNSQADSENPILRGTEPVEEKEYLTDAFTREAVRYIHKQKDPFFLYLTYNAVHGPMEPAEKYMARFPHITDPKRRIFAGMLAGLDEGVGAVLRKLREKKIEDNTLVFFVADNGGPTAVNTSKNDPLRGFKGQVLEGGIRVPFLMQWTGGLPKGKVYDKPVIALDILPTAVAAAGGTAKAKLDGVNLAPYVEGRNRGTPHEMLYWRFGAQSAIRKGDWKLIQDGEGGPQLYNLAEDVGESQNLAASQSARVKELQVDYEAWNGQLMEPRWNSPRRLRTGETQQTERVRGRRRQKQQ